MAALHRAGSADLGAGRTARIVALPMQIRLICALAFTCGSTVDVQTGRAAASIWDLFPASSDINVVRCWDLGMEKLSTNARAA
ncbi:MAG: hypothetical protein ACRDNF_19610, partial [Streptosporangiaceae bacterium]